MIPICRLSVGAPEAAAAAQAVASGWLAQGKRTEQFESLVADYVGAKHAIATNSCTTGLHLALLAAGIRPGDEVICPSFSFIATANAIVYAGATPVFVDIDRRTFNIDPGQIEAAITPRTKAIMPVSQIGLAADLPTILAIARRHELKVVEDAAPSFGATIGRERVGSISDFTCFSFDARKILTTGEGGIITTDEDAAADRLRALRAHAASVSMLARHTSTSVVLEQYPEVGFNFKLTDIQAAIGIVQMGRVEEIITERRRLAQRYADLLGDDDRLELPYEPKSYRHVFQSYCVRLRTDHTQLEVMSSMAARSVATRRIIAIHLEPFYRKLFPELELPQSQNATNETILLPLFVGLTDVEQDQVVDALLHAVSRPDHHRVPSTMGLKAALR